LELNYISGSGIILHHKDKKLFPSFMGEGIITLYKICMVQSTETYRIREKEVPSL
jgi:hypothetical protein